MAKCRWQLLYAWRPVSDWRISDTYDLAFQEALELIAEIRARDPRSYADDRQWKISRGWVTEAC